MRFLCDEMLAGFGRWLRAAGYDTALARPGAPDAALLGQAAAEARLFLTRDRKVMERRAAAGAVLVRGDFDAVAAQLRGLGVDWLRAPFSRCLMDNAPLRPATPEEAEDAPSEARPFDGPINRCPDCGRLYWPGSHVRRMRERLTAWAAGSP
jgi:uncharacterized protein with PIN domain